MDEVCCIFLRPRRLARICSDFVAPGVEEGEDEDGSVRSPPVAFLLQT